MTIGDLVILNVLFLLCSLPIFTIGAAQAGLYTGLRVLVDKEDDSSPAAAFFRGFTSGFGKITVVHSLLLVLVVVISYMSALVYMQKQGAGLAVWLSLVSILISTILPSVIYIFHSRFTCTAIQLFRNAWLLFLAHPLRCALVALLTWSPIYIALIDLQIFILATPVFITVYFSFASLLSNSLMKKPFQDLIQMFNEKNQIPEQTEDITE